MKTIKRGAYLISALAATLLLQSVTLAGEARPGEPKNGEPHGNKAASAGRPVRVASFSFRPGSSSFERVLQLVDEVGAGGTDLIVLPETWLGQNDKTMEPLEGPTVKALSVLAQKHHTYIVSPLDCAEKGRRSNTAVVIDRFGKVTGRYDKVYPYWSEYDHKQAVLPGAGAKAIECDFGKLGIAICFDANFPEVWQALDDSGAELVVWPSAYSAGQHLQAYALTHHYYIVTATYTGDCQVYDLTGQRILDERNDGINISRITLDLDRGIYHENFNIEKRDKLLKAHADDVAQEQFLNREQWFVLKAKHPGISARTLAHQYGLEELRDYINRSRREINKMRLVATDR